jgi:hypothetical protein
VIDVDSLLAIGAAEGAAALGLETWPDAVVDGDDLQLRGVEPDGLYEALVFSCASNVLRNTSAQ